jgi:hypothetical protein
VTDSDGAATAAATSVAVANVAPALTLDPVAAIAEGGVATLSGVVTDPGVLDTFTLMVSWGDGTAAQAVAVGADRRFSARHTYLNNPAGGGAFTAAVTAADNGGGTGSAAAAVAVANVAPSMLALNAGSINEGGTFTLAGSFSDPGALDAHTVVIDWGDGGGPTTLTLAAGVVAFTANHPYADDSRGGAFVVSATVTDSDGAAVASGTAVAVANVAPTLTLDPVAAISEGGTATLSGLVTDPGVFDTFTLTVEWGDGSGPQAVAVGPDRHFAVQHQYLNNSPGGGYAVAVAAADNGGATGSAGTTAVVANVAPAGLTLNSGSVAEGGTFTLTGSFADPGALDRHTVVIDWGDGSAPTTLALDPNVLTFTAAHAYLDDLPGGAAAGVTVTDADGAAVAAGTTVAVANVAPTVTLDLVSPISEGGTATLSGTITDQGVFDTFTLTVNWDDGSAPEAVAVGPDRRRHVRRRGGRDGQRRRDRVGHRGRRGRQRGPGRPDPEFRVDERGRDVHPGRQLRRPGRARRPHRRHRLGRRRRPDRPGARPRRAHLRGSAPLPRRPSRRGRGRRHRDRF